MKNFVIALLISAASPSAFALNSKLALSSIKNIELLTKDEFVSSKLIKEVHLYENSIDYLELIDGLIIDRTDIKKVNYLEEMSKVYLVEGVDGGG